MKNKQFSPDNSDISHSTQFPYGMVTFLFTDIEGSTPLWEKMPDEMREAVTQHRIILRQAIEAHQGHEFQVFGDSFQAAFSQAIDGLHAALKAQRALRDANWGPTGSPKVRMGLHTGIAVSDPTGEAPYAISHTLNRSARVMSAGYGGQILLSQEAADQVTQVLPEGVTLKDLGEHRLKGMLRLEHIYQAVSNDLPQDFPPLPTAISPPNNLPAQLSSFIGRDREIVEIEKLINPNQPTHYRLITLTGPGGTGKTRLSLQIGANLLYIFSGGTWIVELASISDPKLVPQTVMTALNIQADASRSSLSVLCDYFREKTALLILDNCEHLVEACAQLCACLLVACPNLHILASSREVLGITGEKIMHILPLSIPKVISPTPEEVLHSEAGRLFIERASSVQPGFTVTIQTAPAIAQICRQLDGIPLAIELAAARVKLLSVEQIASRLDDRFRLLTAGSRTALPRHQTLKALVDWSWDLLNPAEQIMLRRLSVFAGGWTLEAAQALGDDPFEVLEILFQLENKSLIISDAQTGQPNRYRMLETIRRYSQDKLIEAGELQLVLSYHRDWFLKLAEQAEPELKRQNQITWTTCLELEHDNLRQALKYSIEQRSVEKALRLASALHYFWWIRGYYEEGCHWLEAALQFASEKNEWYSSIWRARALLGLGWIKKSQGDYIGALAIVEEGLKLSQNLADKPSIAFALYLKSLFLFDRMNPSAHRSMVAESMEICREINDQWIMGGCLYHMSEIATNNLEGCTFLEKSVETYRQNGDRFILTYSLASLAWLILAQGDSKNARLYFEESLEISREVGRNDSTAYSALQLSVLARWQGDFIQAHMMNEESLAIYQDMGNRQGQAWAYCLLAELDHLQGHPELAITTYQENLKIFPEISDNWKTAWCYEKLGDAYYHLGEYQKAISNLEASLSLLGEDSEIYYPIMILGEVERAQGNYERAARYYKQSIEKLNESGGRLFIPPRLEAMAKIAVSMGDVFQAVILFAAAQLAREKMGIPVSPLEFADYQHNLKILYSRMDKDSFESAWRAGQELTLEHATEQALYYGGHISTP